ncbi:MAG: thiolase C-terminal domain-containing protein, partial [Acidimicrobiales bacterium]
MPLNEINDARDRCAIIGIGSTDFGRNSGRTPLTLASAAALAAVADAGLTPQEIDGVIHSDYDLVQANHLAHSTGMANLSYWGATGIGGGAPCGMIGQAVAAVTAGLAQNVLVFRALNGHSGLRFSRGSGVQKTGGARFVGGNSGYEEFFFPFGLFAPGQMWAMIARRHMHEYGTTSEDLANIALTVRRRANSNPLAQMYGRQMTMEDYREARMISDPLRLFDYCQETDGACAVVVTSTERSRDAAQPSVIIRAVSQGTGSQPQVGTYFSSLMRESLTVQPSLSSAETLYRRAAMGPEDIDVAQFYDCFTPTVLLQLEDYGFCKKGEGGSFASSGALDLDGEIPINTAGGNLSEGYIHGMNHILEGVRQIRGTSTSQVLDARTCLVTSGIPTTTSALI